MKKSITNLRLLSEKLCFKLVNPDTAEVVSWDGKNIPPGVFTGKTPRVRMLGTRIGEEKTNTFKDMRAEFSHWIFPLRFFYLDEGVVGLGSLEFMLLNPEDLESEAVEIQL